MEHYQHSSEELFWSEVYSALRFYVRKHVCNANVQSWFGQEYDIIEDIVQESVVRAYLYTLKVENGIVSPIVSLKHFSKRIAHNHTEDLRRREARLVRPSVHESNTGIGNTTEIYDGSWVDPIEEALEELALLSLLVEVAHIIEAFPQKRRTALLIDLANLSDVGEQSSPLETALLEVGICLKDYQQILPFDYKCRSQHASLLSGAYKHLRDAALPHLKALHLIA